MLALSAAASWAGDPVRRDPYHPQLTGAMPPIDVLLTQFERIAYSNEFGGQHRLGRIVKWVQPVRVAITGVGAKRFEPFVFELIARLRRLSGLRIEAAKWYQAARPNFEIQFVDRRPPGQAPCATFIYDQNFTITRVRIVISSRLAPLRRHCIVEELTQALGLGDDSSLIFPSIFNDSSRQQSLFPWDEIMLQTLYDRRIYPGMRKAAARPLVRRILARLAARVPATTQGPKAAPKRPAKRARPVARPAPPPAPKPAPPVKLPPGMIPLDPGSLKQ